MPGRASFEYSAKPGDSVYPIESGVVVKLEANKHKFNRSARLHLSHGVYVWICRVGMQPARCSPKYRKVHIIIVEIPTLQAFRDHIIVARRSVQFKYLTTLMKNNGYEVVSRSCRQNYTEWSLCNFYKTIGVMA